MNEWNIQSRGHVCQSCHQPFANGEVYHTILFDEKRDFLRTDVCVRCWTEQFSESRARKGFISCWHGEYEAPPAPVEAIQKENAETLLRKLIEVNDPKYTAVSFILAVMLERKRLLKVKEQIKLEGQRIFVYEQPKTGDVFTIPDPNLQLNQLEEVQRDVAHLLEHGLPGEAVASPAPTAPVSEGQEGQAGDSVGTNESGSVETRPSPAENPVAEAAAS